MANWCNARLLVAGRREEVLSFSRLARVRPLAVFGPDMMHGETADLGSARIATLGPGLAKKVYRFQIRNDDGQEHFCWVSRQFQALRFVLVYFDPNNDPSGSYFIAGGRARSYELPTQLQEAVMAKHGVTEDSDDDGGYWEASWELMDLAEAHWQKALLDSLRSRGARSNAQEGPRGKGKKNRKRKT
jgi:hypothetical protein